MAVDVTRLVQQAAEAAKLVPENLQEAAFNRAFDALLSGVHAGTNPPKAANAGSAKSRTRAPTQPSNTDRDISAINRTAHPEITHSAGVLENALRLLKAAKDDLGIDGLTGSEIARVLTDKFRCRTSKQGVSRAMNDSARKYVDRRQEGRNIVFRIMAPGEEYLASLASGSTTADRHRPKSQGKSKRAERSTSQEAPKAESSNAETSKGKASRARASKGKVGPATAMETIFETGFFGSPRTISDIQVKLKHDRGRTFKPNELSPVLLRWLRNGKLTRAQNADGQYEYSTP